ncbi:MAG: MFS transporter, partial [Treponemataceae bacterium]
MFSILLAIIYVAFISLGLPDAILGSAWPSMYENFNVPVASAGIIGMIIAGGTIFSSFFSSKVIFRLGVGLTTLFSVALTAVALYGFSRASVFWMLCAWAIPYGLGAGSVDAALNNFVALHYKSRHMSWLHCFWGIGAMLGPFIMGLCLTNNFSWNRGYQVIAGIQVLLVAILFFSLPLWKIKKTTTENNTQKAKEITLKEAMHLPGARPILLAFFSYCALESSTGFWASTYMVL